MLIAYLLPTHYMSVDTSTHYAYDQWLDSELPNLKKRWQAFSDADKEELGDFDTYCRQEYDDSRDFSNSGL